MYLLFATTFSENFLFIEGLSSPGILLATLAEDALNYNATANDGDERSATVTLSRSIHL